MPFSNAELVQHFQNIIDLDAQLSLEIASKTKILYKKFHGFAADTKEKHDKNAEISEEISNSNKCIEELKEVLEDRQAEYVRLKQQIEQKISKQKKNNNKNGVTDTGAMCYLSDADRNIHFKKQLKVELLRQSTKMHFMEEKSQNKIVLKGYTVAELDLFPFEQKFNAQVAAEEVSAAVWDEIGKHSKYKAVWDGFLNDDSLDNQNATVI